jgi:hypothetical protein
MACAAGRIFFCPGSLVTAIIASHTKKRQRHKKEMPSSNIHGRFSINLLKIKNLIIFLKNLSKKNKALTA